jgi:hypothetical protein
MTNSDPDLSSVVSEKKGVRAIDAVPMSWLDPLLTGPKAVIGNPPYGCPDIERLLNAIRDRLAAQSREELP